MHTGIWLAALSILLFPAMVSAQGGSAADEKAIRDLEAQWETAWNRHDVPAMLRIFAPDVDVVNLSGAWFKGRDRFAAASRNCTAAGPRRAFGRWRKST